MPRNAFSAVLLAATLSFAAGSYAQEPAQPHHQMPQPTNLQVLPKDIAPQELMKIMRGFTAQLGVECGFCHAQDPATHRLNFASDAKPDKGIARIMLQMTETINSKYLAQVQDPDATPEVKTVTCGTCHRGNSMPVPFVPPAHPEHHEDHPAPMGAMPQPPQ